MTIDEAMRLAREAANKHATPANWHGLEAALRNLLAETRDNTWDEAYHLGRCDLADAKRELAAKSAEVERLRAERDTAVQMLAEWCVAVDVGGAGWDEWDDYYKDAAYRPGPLREQIDAAMTAHRKLMGHDK